MRQPEWSQLSTKKKQSEFTDTRPTDTLLWTNESQYHWHWHDMKRANSSSQNSRNRRMGSHSGRSISLLQKIDIFGGVCCIDFVAIVLFV